MDFERIEEVLGRLLEGTGVAIVFTGAVRATATFLDSARRAASIEGPYRPYRRSLPLAILLGLEFLIAGDIVRTVAIDSTFRSVGILAIIIAIRTFLSIELQLEIEGQWPWQADRARGRLEAPQR